VVTEGAICIAAATRVARVFPLTIDKPETLGGKEVTRHGFR
jgi:hypothetical protein